MFVDLCYLFVVCCLVFARSGVLFVDWRLTFFLWFGVVWGFLLVGCGLLVWCPLFVVAWPFAIGCQLLIGCCLFFVACCLVFAVWCLLLLSDVLLCCVSCSLFAI